MQMNLSSTLFWLVWAVVLIWQNYSFTQVSRARNSGSLKRHVIAALQSNGVWFISQIFAVSAFVEIIKGKHGWGMALFAALFYTVFTMSGSIFAHYRSLKTEKGDTAVGANKKYKQVTVEEWKALKDAVLNREFSATPFKTGYIPVYTPPIAGQRMKL